MNLEKEKTDHKELTDHLFRHSYAKMIAVLVRYFGLKQIEVAEDIVQDTLMEAMEKWSVESTPDNPEGWLMDVAKKKTINFLRRRQTFQNKVLPQLSTGQSLQDEIIISKHTITDSTLRMIFCCCHPSLPIESQIALALKTLCGFSIPEIANALLTNEANINKRLYRAKKKFRDGSISYEIPPEDSSADRLGSVLKVLYLLFNEGYYSQQNSMIIRVELCFEAIRLLKVIFKSYPYSSEVTGLLALMYFQIARIEGRLDENGILIVLEEQNRSLWNKELINLGIEALGRSTKSDRLSTYQLQAGIALEHAIAKDFKHTNWQSIYKQYIILTKIDNSPIIQLNKAISRFYLGEERTAIDDILSLKNNTHLRGNALYHCTLGKLFSMMNEKTKALDYLGKALEYSKSNTERKNIEKLIGNL